MRRMNSILLGHQGASGRTDCMYLSMAICTVGSSHDSGRRTMRLGTVMSVAWSSSASISRRMATSVSSGSVRLS